MPYTLKIILFYFDILDSHFEVLIASPWFWKVPWYVVGSEHFESLPRHWYNFTNNAALFRRTMLAVFDNFLLLLFVTSLTASFKSSLSLRGSTSYPNMWGVHDILSLSNNLETILWRQPSPFKNTILIIMTCFGSCWRPLRLLWSYQCLWLVS